jgi:hypothetical protein
MSSSKAFVLIKQNRAIVIVLAFSLLVAGLLTVFAGRSVTITIPGYRYPSETAEVSFRGKQGMDALSLLKQHAPVGLNALGQITAIDNIRPDKAKHENWTLFVNGKRINVNPKYFQTNGTQNIMWKIEKS